MNIENFDIDKNGQIGNKFSFVDTMGSLINNNEFSKGYINFKAQNKTSDVYIWEALSAISDTLGQTIYNNVEKYIDNVCDIDICKIDAITSQMCILGMNYKIVKEYKMFPLEILNVMNLFSIKEKFLFRDGYFKEELISSLYENNVLSGVIEEKGYIYYDSTISGNITYKECRDNRILNQNEYENFLSAVYFKLMLDVLTQTYELSDYIFPDVLKMIDIDNYDDIESDVLLKKKQWGISKDFNYEDILNNIYSGNDNIDNYQGYELSLLNYVQEKRKSAKNENPTTRYYYYKQDKIKEYIQFIENRYYSISLSSNTTEDLNYEYDNNYYKVKTDNQKLFLSSVCDTYVTKQYIYDNYINHHMFLKVINSLVKTTLYIKKLREKIKIQTRKNYMRGTNNLLIYLINEYLIEYFKNNDVSSIQIIKRENDTFTNDIEIIEYDDETEYSNIQTKYDYYSSLNGSTCNSRFWEDRMDADGIEFKLQDIENFYLSVMNIKYGLTSDTHDFLTAFLSTIYNSGAAIESYNENGFLNTKMDYYDGAFTEEIYERHNRFIKNYTKFNSYVDHDTYTYPEDVLSVQVEDVISSHIYVKLSNEYYQSISDVYDEFYPQVISVSSDVEEYNSEYEAILTGDCSFYFKKPDEQDYPYCYTSGVYKHPEDYYISSAYDADLTYIYDKMISLQQFISKDTSIKNYPILDTVEKIKNDLSSIIYDFQKNVINQIIKYGYVDISSDLLTDNSSNVKSFLQEKLTARNTMIQSNIDSIREQANELLTLYNTLYQNATNAFANCASRTDLSAMYISFGAGRCQTSEFEKGEGYVRLNAPSKDYPDAIYNWNDKKYYAEANEKTKGNYHVRPENPTNTAVTEILEGDLQTVINGFLEYLTQITGLDIIKRYEEDAEGKLTAYCDVTEIQGKFNAGSYAAAQELLTQYSDLLESYSVLAGKYNAMTDDSISESPTDLKSAILELIAKVSDSEFPEIVYAKDTMAQTYQKYNAYTLQIEKQFSELDTNYKAIFTDSNQSTYLSEIKNVSDLTLTNINKVYQYTNNKDINNKQSLKTQIQELINKYLASVQNIITIIQDMSTRTTLSLAYIYKGDFLENEITYVLEFLENDVKNKYIQSKNIIDYNLQQIRIQIGYVLEELTEYEEETISLDEMVTEKLSYLDFTTKTEYKNKKELYLNYCGNDNCYYPYYNFENKEHPSYQIHPFMWNLIEHNTAVENFAITMVNTFIQDFEPSNIVSKINSYIGELGQSINEWNNNVIDYTGYTTSYENNNHLYNNTLTSEVVNYEGIFYPKAFDYLMTKKDMSINSLQYFVDTNYRAIKTNFATLVYSITTEDDSGLQILNNIQTVISGYTDILSDNIEGLKNLTVDGQLSSKLLSDISKTKLFTVIENIIAPSFYENYYNHLNMSKGDVELEIQRLSIYYNEISSIGMDRDLSSIYDIYSYKKDVYDNTYILLKQYFKENPTYKEKRNTLGQLWIRKNNYPFAFPAFHGELPSIEMYTKQYCMPTIYRLSNTYNNQDLSVIKNPLIEFFDFDFTENKNNLILFAHQTDKGYIYQSKKIDTYNEDENIDWLKNIEHCAILFGYISELILEKQNYKTILTIYDENTNGTNKKEYIFSCENSKERPNTQLSNTYNFIGYYNTNLYDSYYVYVHKKNDNEILENEQIKIIGIENGELMTSSSGTGYIAQSSYPIITSSSEGEVCFSYDSNILTFAYLQNQNCVDYTTCKGQTLLNPHDKEMNSNDIFCQSLIIVKTKIVSNNLVSYSGNNYDAKTNINADMSYIPVLPSNKLSDAFDLTDNKYNLEYLQIQLMGKSKNIDNIINNINVDYDPYYDYESIRTNYEYGRVYEDYISSETNITCIVNDTINVEDGILQWTTNKGAINIKKSDIPNTQVIITTNDSLGRKPYFVGYLNQLTSKYTVNNYDIKSDNEQIYYTDKKDKITVNGTDFYGKYIYSTNNIKGIQGIDIQYIQNDDEDYGQFVFDFDLIEGYPTDYIHLNKNKINIVIFNKNDISYLYKFHMLDTYGIMYAYVTDEYTANRYVVDINNWHIVNQKTNIIDDEEDKKNLKSYFINKYGFQEFLSEIKLENFNNIEDLWIYTDTKGLQFKTEEGIFFTDERNYYPSLNKNYPPNSIYLYENKKYVMKDYQLSDIYDNDNVYLLQTIDEDYILNNIGRVTIEISNTLDEFYIVDESILSNEVIGDIKIYNYEKFDSFDINNVNFLSLYLHSYENGKVSSEFNDITELNDLGYICKSESYTKNLDGYIKHIEPNNESISLSDFLYIAVSYKKNDNMEIELYFNYQNYIESKFIELDDTKRPVFGLIDNTYLKLGPNESGNLNICLQFKSFDVYGNINGIKNIIVASYNIYNISDDKPKFLMDETYKISKDDYYNDQVKEFYRLYINAQDYTYVVHEDEEIEEYFDYTIYLEYNYSSIKDVVITMDIPEDIIDVVQETSEDYDISRVDNKVKILIHQNIYIITIRFKWLIEKKTMLEYNGYVWELYIECSQCKDENYIQSGLLKIYKKDLEIILANNATTNKNLIGVINDTYYSNNEIYRVK